MTPAIFAYICVGAVVGAFSMLPLMESSLPDEAHGAVALTVGLLWPLAIAGGIGYVLCRFARMLGRSFAVLYRHWWPRRVDVPRAKARKKRT